MLRRLGCIPSPFAQARATSSLAFDSPLLCSGWHFALVGHRLHRVWNANPKWTPSPTLVWLHPSHSGLRGMRNSPPGLSIWPPIDSECWVAFGVGTVVSTGAGWLVSASRLARDPRRLEASRTCSHSWCLSARTFCLVRSDHFWPLFGVARTHRGHLHLSCAGCSGTLKPRPGPFDECGAVGHDPHRRGV